MLEMTGTIPKRSMREQFLDKMDIERERGITIKLQTVRMEYRLPDYFKRILPFDSCILNLIDTPGHVDFSYEVERSLVACDGAVLLVDATQGIQAQSIAHAQKALEQKLTLIPVVNKIDLPHAQTEAVSNDLVTTFGFKKEEILRISAKTGQGVERLMVEVVKRVPPPVGNRNAPLRALIFDSFYDVYLGVVALVRIMEGGVNQADHLLLMREGKIFKVGELGVVKENLVARESLGVGEVGYIATGIKEISKVRVGETVTKANPQRLDEKWPKVPLPGYQEPKPMVFASFYPAETDRFQELKVGLEKLKLNDAALTFEQQRTPALGIGFLMGFLGLLHLDVTRERLEREYGLEVIVGAPSVMYLVKLRSQDEKIVVRSPVDFPKRELTEEVLEPWVKVSIYTPVEYLGTIFELVKSRRGEYLKTQYFGQTVKQYLQLVFRMPLAEIIAGFFDQLKGKTAGFASMSYEFGEYQPVDLVQLEILLNKEVADSLSTLVVKEKAASLAQKLVAGLKESLPRQQFSVPIQASVEGKILARADLPALRKDVTAKLYGGDRTRKDKLLQKQKKGKKRLQKLGRVSIPPEVLLKLLAP